jgi:hypothetical protein
METTVCRIAHLTVIFQQLRLAMDSRNLWTLAAMTALLLKGTRAHLYELANALPCRGKPESRVQKLRRWVSNLSISPECTIAARVRLLAPHLAHLSEVTLIIDRTEWTRLGIHLNLFLCSIAFHGRSFPIFWNVLPTRGCSSFADQQALLTPVLTVLALHPILSQISVKVVADREFCSPKLPRWLTDFAVHFAIRVKKHYRVSRSDIPSTPIQQFLRHCQRTQSYLFETVLLTTEYRFRCHLCITWRADCLEPIALITDGDDASDVIASYGERTFIETLNRDLKSGGYDLERGKVTDTRRLARLLIPLAFAYILAVIQGDIEELIAPRPPVKKRTLSLFTRARRRMTDLLERTPLSCVLTFFQHFFQFIRTLLVLNGVEQFTDVCLAYARQQTLLLQGFP